MPGRDEVGIAFVQRDYGGFSGNREVSAVAFDDAMPGGRSGGLTALGGGFCLDFLILDLII